VLTRCISSRLLLTDLRAAPAAGAAHSRRKTANIPVPRHTPKVVCQFAVVFSSRVASYPFAHIILGVCFLSGVGFAHASGPMLALGLRLQMFELVCRLFLQQTEEDLTASVVVSNSVFVFAAALSWQALLACCAAFPCVRVFTSHLAEPPCSFFCNSRLCVRRICRTCWPPLAASTTAALAASPKAARL
jgi:hypothetical protein